MCSLTINRKLNSCWSWSENGNFFFLQKIKYLWSIKTRLELFSYVPFNISSNCWEFHLLPTGRDFSKSEVPPYNKSMQTQSRQSILGLCRVPLTRPMDTNLRFLSPIFFIILWCFVFFPASDIMIFYEIQTALKVSGLYTGKWKLEMETFNEEPTSNPPLLPT